MKYSALSILFLLLISSNSYGQERALLLGVKAGVNLSNAKEYTNRYTGVGDKNVKWGYQIGFNAEYSMTNSIYLQSGLSLTTKGTIHTGGEVWIGSSTPPITYWQSTTNQIYLQLPLRLGYKINISKLAEIRVNAGPYIAYGIGGKETIKESTTPSSVIEDEKFTSDTFGDEDRRRSPYNLKRQDYGISLGCGVKYKKVILGFDYEVGLLNISRPGKDETSPLPVDYRNRNLSLTVGYIL
jgi:hypothetical protein